MFTWNKGGMMEYSYLIGVLTNFDLEILQWLFYVLFSTIILAGVSTIILTGVPSLIHLNRKLVKFQPYIIFAYFVLSLVLTGIFGLLYVVITHFITYAFISDFKKDYE